MTELFSQFTDNLSGLAFDAMKEHYQEKIEESKLRSTGKTPYLLRGGPEMGLKTGCDV